jgi:transposase
VGVLKRRKFTRDFKLTVIQQVNAGKRVAEVARMYEIAPQMIWRWHSQAEANPNGAFTRGKRPAESRVAELERMIGQLTMENAFLKKALLRLEEQRTQRNATTGNGSTNSLPKK